jgi:excisionase family DNA binding protein
MPQSPNQPESESGDNVEVVRVSISEGARLFGIHSRTIRRALAQGQIRYIVVCGRYKINFESLLRWSQRQPTVQKKLNAQGIGQWVSKWKIRNPKYSPHKPGV